MRSNQTIYQLLTITKKALLYLKVRAICRGKLIKQFTEKYQLELKSTKVTISFPNYILC